MVMLDAATLARWDAERAERRTQWTARLAGVGITVATVPDGAREASREEGGEHFALGWVLSGLTTACEVSARHRRQARDHGVRDTLASLRAERDRLLAIVEESVAVLSYASGDLTDAQAGV